MSTASHPAVKKRDLRDPAAELEEKREWSRRPYKVKLDTLELLRRMWLTIDTRKGPHGSLEGFRRVFRIVKRP